MVSNESFVDSLEWWLTAVRTGDYSAAKVHAEIMQKHAKQLVLDRGFREAVCARWPDLEPADALQQFTRFLMCATEASERAVKTMGADNLFPRNHSPC